jgi:hypothetical protein
LDLPRPPAEGTVLAVTPDSTLSASTAGSPAADSLDLRSARDSLDLRLRPRSARALARTNGGTAVGGTAAGQQCTAVCTAVGGTAAGQQCTADLPRVPADLWLAARGDTSPDFWPPRPGLGRASASGLIRAVLAAGASSAIHCDVLALRLHPRQPRG